MKELLEPQANMRGHHVPHSGIAKKRMSLAHIGKMVDEANPQWKGNDVGYNALHSWIARKRGRPQVCEHCGTSDKRQYNWANKSGLYARDLNDWIRLCVPCHRKHDGWNPWANHIKNADRECAAIECPNPVKSMELCNKHYLAEWRMSRA